MFDPNCLYLVSIWLRNPATQFLTPMYVNSCFRNSGKVISSGTLMVYSVPQSVLYGPNVSASVMNRSPQIALLYGWPTAFLLMPYSMRLTVSEGCIKTSFRLYGPSWVPNRLLFTSIASTTSPACTKISSSGDRLSLQSMASGHSLSLQSHDELSNSRSLEAIIKWPASMEVRLYIASAYSFFRQSQHILPYLNAKGWLAGHSAKNRFPSSPGFSGIVINWYRVQYTLYISINITKSHNLRAFLIENWVHLENPKLIKIRKNIFLIFQNLTEITTD